MTDFRHQFPAIVTLTSSPIVDVAAVRIALASPSRQVVSYWKRYHNFPGSHREGRNAFLVTDELHQWLTGNGVTVRRMPDVG